ncbi:putative protein phosphatase 2C 8 [Tetrabaena socialis]|uniref:protein-serine/threonine phosphatase n=1 Tax=Tetrabaena socialis TaxID=47790 RepID=A0A2J8ACS7_9CHLO|nr:putative protein phosphatase 2C 8 [Tetrabaena socialis]|eukprot:PNH10320.1 putative protein phosphatase 2C 8 [Tetrabaena socialis]
MSDTADAMPDAKPAPSQEKQALGNGEVVSSKTDAPALKRGAVEGADGEELSGAKRQARREPAAAASGGPAAGGCSGNDAPPSSSAAASSPAHIPLAAAFSEDQGCRHTMEDVCVCVLDARPEPPNQACRLSYFGVFDGHGGSTCASFAAQHLHAHVLRCGLLSKGLQAADAKVDAKACKACIVEGFKAADQTLLKECAAKSWQDGACAVAVWVLQNLVLVANVGDAKCILARMPETAGGAAAAQIMLQPKAIVLTKEHTALLERQRIEKAGGTVINGRLAGRVQISRSFGDTAFKKLGCSSTPDVTAFPLTTRDTFLLLGCDGFWGVFGAQEAVDAASKLLAEGKDAKSITNRLLNMAIREKRCADNCTVLLVKFG